MTNCVEELITTAFGFRFCPSLLLQYLICRKDYSAYRTERSYELFTKGPIMGDSVSRFNPCICSTSLARRLNVTVDLLSKLMGSFIVNYNHVLFVWLQPRFL